MNLRCGVGWASTATCGIAVAISPENAHLRQLRASLQGKGQKSLPRLTSIAVLAKHMHKMTPVLRARTKAATRAAMIAAVN